MLASKLALVAVTSALVSALVPALSGPAASAGAEKQRDARHDVVSRDRFSDDLPRTPEPDRPLGDITSIWVSYGEDLVVTTRFRGLAAVGHQEFSWFILTSSRPREGSWSATLVVGPGRDRGRFILLEPLADQPRCGSATLDRPARTVTLTIPAACLHDPDWVRVSNGAMFLDRGREYHDDARRDGVSGRGWKLGPKVHRS